MAPAIPDMERRVRISGVLTMLLLSLLVLAMPATARDTAFPRVVTDVVGREVRIEAAPQRILLAEGIQLLSLGLVAPDPTERLAMIGRDLEAFDPGLHAMLLRAFPRLGDLPTIGDDGAGLPIESALAARPDLVILSRWQYDKAAGLVDEFTALGVPVVVIDFFAEPIANTPKSLALLGDLLGHPERAKAYTDFYGAHLAKVGELTAGLDRPSVLVHAYPGTWACCWSAGRTGFGEFLEIAGGRNIGADLLPNELGGPLAPEYVLVADPDVYVATGISGGAGSDGVVLGAGIAPDEARAGLARVALMPTVADLRAVRKGRAHAVWNFFNGSPLNILAVEALALWLHPELEGKIDPAATLAEIDRRFAATPITGTFWTSLAAGAAP
ncbi:ABC transporter substrate-binding protein [Methylobrevis pamukkalensis]|uniref:ABC transporter substrate-binding protein n=1 Tax=Methylobrevis pamukkalensis TaxID=1439726 RepID=UPI00114C8DF3|nr:ABC transporter substrate-binding protein [Methylobrevis pamukkalensis]